MIDNSKTLIHQKDNSIDFDELTVRLGKGEDHLGNVLD